MAKIRWRAKTFYKQYQANLWEAATLFLCLFMAVMAIHREVDRRERGNYGNLTVFPAVEYDMMKAEYWLKKMRNPDQVYYTEEEIAQLNERILHAEGTQMYDLANAPNIAEGKAKNVIAYLICTTRANLKAYPTKALLLEDEKDPDFDSNQLSSIRVNEPMVATSISENGRYYFVYTSNCCGWVEADSVAVCHSKEQWLLAWQIPSEKVLVVTGIEASLSESNAVPELSGLRLPMGTTLSLVAEEEIPVLLNNRSPYYNYIVEMPVRERDGTYGTRQAMIAVNQEVHVGYLLLSRTNIVTLAMKGLGNVYGWGGMLNSNDCSGYLRDIYRCFGLELPRNTVWQQAIPTKKYAMSQLSMEEKKKLLNRLPAGTILFFDGHEMLYLGKAQKEYYVLSATGSVMNEEQTSFDHLRSISINPLSTTRRENQETWLESLSMAVIPFL